MLWRRRPAIGVGPYPHRAIGPRGIVTAPPLGHASHDRGPLALDEPIEDEPATSRAPHLVAVLHAPPARLAAQLLGPTGRRVHLSTRDRAQEENRPTELPKPSMRPHGNVP